MTHLFKTISSTLVAMLGIVIAFTAFAGDIVLSLEEPANASTYTGIANVRGWVVGSAGINRVELYVDGELKTNIPVGGRRSDVGAQYPSYPDSSNAGYSMAFNYSSLIAGQHTILVRAIDKSGDVKSASATFNVVRFDNPFIANASSINLSQATVSHDNTSIVINNMTADGKTYDIRLEWRTAIQGYAITQIIPTGGGQIQDFSGTYKLELFLVSNTCPTTFYSSGTEMLLINQTGNSLSAIDTSNNRYEGTVDTTGSFSLHTMIAFNASLCFENLVVEGNFIYQNQKVSAHFKSSEICNINIAECDVVYEGTIIKN